MPCAPAASIAGRPAPRGCRCAGMSPSSRRQAAAEEAGFRAVQALPAAATPRSAERHVAAIGRACALIRARDTLPSLAELADAAGISRFHFHRVFKQITGATPREWGKAHRIGRFAERLDAGESVAAVGLRRRFRRQLAGLRGGAERARHDPGGAAPRRQGRDDPLHDRADPARPGDRRRHGARHLHDRARRRSGDARSRAAAALPGGGLSSRRMRR